MMNEHEHQNDAMQGYWDSQRPLFERIKESGGVAPYVGNIEHLEKMFAMENHDVCCMDERTPNGDIRYAGSGILDQARALSHMREAKAAGVYSHKGCGAGALAFGRLSEKEKQTYKNAEEYAKWWAKELAAQLGVEYKGHLDAAPKFHIARVLYYDGTGKFNPSRGSEFPPGFVISRRYLGDSSYAKEELAIAMGIAFGDHGFGNNRFSESEPFLIIPIGDSHDSRFSLEALSEEAKEVAKKLTEQYKNKVRIEGFNAPTEAAQ